MERGAGMNDKHRDEILKEAVDEYGVILQVDICIEEMAELTKALLKMRRHKENNPLYMQDHKLYLNLHKNILEEIADVQIMLDQMRIVYGFTLEVENSKIDRLKTRLERDKKLIKDMERDAQHGKY